MFSIRHRAVRSLVSATTILTRIPRSTSFLPPIPQLVPFAPGASCLPSGTSFRSYASDNESRTQSAISSVSGAAAQVSAKVGEAAAAATRFVSNEKGETHQKRQREPLDAQGATPGDVVPSTNLYIGNLFFEVSESTLQREFEKYGNVTRVRIITDDRGMSRGYGYVHFSTVAEAEAAMEALNQAVLEGRRMMVQYAVNKEFPGRGSAAAGGSSSRGNSRDFGPKNLPSRTLFIGNMSFEMSDKDLNDLFRQVKNVLDVRVAVDRRTGQPRGFAHADFLDVQSATAAVEVLRNKEFYGRILRVDFSGKSSTDRAGERGDSRRSRDRSEPREPRDDE